MSDLTWSILKTSQRINQVDSREENWSKKEVCHYANVENPGRCFVRLFKKYVSLCPSSAKAFYVQPLSKPSPTCWYSSNPLGHYTISKTMKRLCDYVGIEGFITNYSLHATAATRLYESGVNEQLIMERTGHRSLEGVRSYKRTIIIGERRLLWSGVHCSTEL